MPTGADYTREENNTRQRFVVGERVKAKNMNPSGHTRLPRYIRGREGKIVEARGSFVFPDTVAHDLGESPQLLYSVRFEASELWGNDNECREAVYIDMWDSYLERIR